MMQTKLKKAPSTPEKLMTMPYTIISKLKTNQNHPNQLHMSLLWISKIRSCQPLLFLNPCPGFLDELATIEESGLHYRQKFRVRSLDGGKFLVLRLDGIYQFSFSLLSIFDLSLEFGDLLVLLRRISHTTL